MPFEPRIETGWRLARGSLGSRLRHGGGADGACGFLRPLGFRRRRLVHGNDEPALSARHAAPGHDARPERGFRAPGAALGPPAFPPCPLPARSRRFRRQEERCVKGQGPIGIVGGGAWGTALANVAASAGHDAILWLRDSALAKSLATERMNARFLPGVPLAAGIHPTTDLSDLSGVRCVLLVTPAQTTRQLASDLAAVLADEAPLVICAKGFERDSNAFLSDVVAAARPLAPVAVLSGPSFAADVARGLPTAVTLAAKDPALVGGACGAPVRSDFPRLSPQRRARRRDRRRGEERARDRLRRRRRQGPRRERQGGAHRPRLCRASALRAGLWRRGRDADGPFRPRRPRSDLRLRAVAQLRLRRAARPRDARFRAAGGALVEGAFTAPLWRLRGRATSRCRSRRRSRRSSRAARRSGGRRCPDAPAVEARTLRGEGNGPLAVQIRTRGLVLGRAGRRRARRGRTGAACATISAKLNLMAMKKGDKRLLLPFRTRARRSSASSR